MATFVVDCPHCNALRMTFEIAGYAAPPLQDANIWNAYAFGVCGHCARPVNVELFTPRQFETAESWFSKVVDACDQNTQESLRSAHIAYVVVHTPLASQAVPDHLPEASARAFRAAEASYTNPDAAEVAAMAYRRSVEMAIKETRKDLAGKALHKQIDALEADGTIPKILTDWAHEVRLIGNTGAHDIDDMKPGDLQAVRGFADAFLRYFITLPKELELRRSAIASASSVTP